MPKWLRELPLKSWCPVKFERFTHRDPDRKTDEIHIHHGYLGLFAMVILIKDSANETELKLRMGRNMNQQYKLREVEMEIDKNCGYSKMLLLIEVSPAFKREFILHYLYHYLQLHTGFYTFQVVQRIFVLSIQIQKSQQHQPRIFSTSSRKENLLHLTGSKIAPYCRANKHNGCTTPLKSV